MQQQDSTSPLSQYAALLRQGAPLSAAHLQLVDAILARYPFFTLPAAQLLRDAGAELSDADRARLSAAVALNAPDSASLMKLIDLDGQRFASFYPPEPEPETPSTEKAIDTFLDQYGTADPHEQQLLEKLIFNPVPDYSQVLAREAAPAPEGPVSEQDALLDAFLAGHNDIVAHEEAQREAAAAATEPARPMPDADSPLTESLAKIFIRQHRYDKAYEIISQLSLNFPKKSAYFADQLRFLKKLMLVKEMQSGNHR